MTTHSLARAHGSTCGAEAQLRHGQADSAMTLSRAARWPSTRRSGLRPTVVAAPRRAGRTGGTMRRRHAAASACLGTRRGASRRPTAAAPPLAGGIPPRISGQHRRRARQIVEALIAKDSTDVEAWYQLGEAHFHYGPLRAGSPSRSRARRSSRRGRWIPRRATRRCTCSHRRQPGGPGPVRLAAGHDAGGGRDPAAAPRRARPRARHAG